MVAVAYRTQDRLADYGFSIEYYPDVGWRVHIAFLPCHHDHNESLRGPYLSIDGDGRYYVDWPAKIDSLGEARTVAELWAEIMQNCQHAENRTENNASAVEDQGTSPQLRSDAA